jgi:hypothetical protein
MPRELTLIRVGEKVINLANVVSIDLSWHYKKEEAEGPRVVFAFLMRGMDELDAGQNIAEPYREFFSGEEAEALRRYLKKQCPDLLTAGD